MFRCRSFKLSVDALVYHSVAPTNAKNMDVDERAKHRAEIARMLLARADELYGSMKTAQQEDERIEEDFDAAYQQRTAPMPIEDRPQQPSALAEDATRRVQRRGAKDDRMLANAEIQRLRANVEKAKKQLSDLTNHYSKNPIKVTRPYVSGKPPQQPKPPESDKDAAQIRARSKESKRLEELRVELHRRANEAAQLRQRELALMGVLAATGGLPAKKADSANGTSKGGSGSARSGKEGRSKSPTKDRTASASARSGGHK